jgi:hypothetical protein
MWIFNGGAGLKTDGLLPMKNTIIHPKNTLKDTHDKGAFRKL